jgi:hypothetical protein
MIRDRDRIYGAVVTRRLRAMGIRDRPTALASPWQNGFAERLIGSIRRECVDNVIVLGEVTHTPSLADFTTTTPELKFSVHTTVAATLSHSKSAIVKRLVDVVVPVGQFLLGHAIFLDGSEGCPFVVGARGRRRQPLYYADAAGAAAVEDAEASGVGRGGRFPDGRLCRTLRTGDPGNAARSDQVGRPTSRWRTTQRQWPER